MADQIKKLIAWQDRDRMGSLKALALTNFEALTNPIEYFEKLEIQEDFQEPLTLCFYNSLFLIGVLVPQISLIVPFLVLVSILAITPLSVYVLTFLITKILAVPGEKISFKKTFYVLTFSSPAFMLALIPGIGFWLAAVLIIVLAGIGLVSFHKLDMSKMIFVLIVVPLLVLIPFGMVRFAQDWQERHPVIDAELEAQKILAALSIAAENYSLKNSGNYPLDSQSLVFGKVQYLTKDYCGKTFYHYDINCDFRSYGYSLSADPKGWNGRWKKKFYVTTGGKLREK